MRHLLLSSFFALALLAGSVSFAPDASAQARALCFNDIDCPDDTYCKEKGTQVGGRGVCLTSGESNSQTNGAINNPLKSTSLVGLLMVFLKGVIRIGAIGLLVFLVYVGFTFVAAQGNEEKLRTARTSFMWTVIGGAILLGSEAIVRVIEATANSLKP